MKLICILFLLYSIQICGQGLTISNGKNTKDILNESYLQLYIKHPKLQGSDHCGYVQIYGVLQSTSQDSFQVKMTRYFSSKTNQEFTIESLQIMDDMPSLITISNDDLYSLKYFKSEQNRNRSQTYQGIGFSLMLLGIGTASSGLTWADGDTRKTMLIAGGTEFSLGLILGLIFTKKKHLFYAKDNSNPWHVVRS